MSIKIRSIWKETEINNIGEVMIKLPEYDVKQLVKDLEAKVGRKMSAYAASTGISVILKWIEKSVILSPNPYDNTLLALYPALIKFISTKIDLREAKIDFEMEKEFDFKVLAEQLEKHGLIVAEESAVDVIEISLKWLRDSARASENPYDNVIEMVIPVIIAPVGNLIDGISDDVDSSIDINNEDHEVSDEEMDNFEHAQDEDNQE